MSKFNLAQARLRAQACSAVADAVATTTDALIAFQSVSADVAAMPDVRAWRSDLTPAAVQALTTVTPDTWAMAENAIGQLSSTATPSDEQLHSAHRLATAAVQQAQDAIGAATRAVVVEATTQFVDERYVSRSVAAGESVTGIEAHGENGAVTLFRIGTNGRVDRDYHGYDGFTCDDSDADYVRFLQERGVELDTVVDLHHGDRDDSARLIPAAARADGTSLARGTVLASEATEAVSTALSGRSVFDRPTNRAARSRTTAGGAA